MLARLDRSNVAGAESQTLAAPVQPPISRLRIAPARLAARGDNAARHTAVTLGRRGRRGHGESGVAYGKCRTIEACGSRSAARRSCSFAMEATSAPIRPSARMRAARLEEGAICNGRIVCPWHKGAFRVSDGALVEPPALDGLARYAVRMKETTSLSARELRRRDRPTATRRSDLRHRRRRSSRRDGRGGAEGVRLWRPRCADRKRAWPAVRPHLAQQIRRRGRDEAGGHASLATDGILHATENCADRGRGSSASM